MPEIGIADKETLDKIDTNVGAKTDAASSTGSLHAKVRDAKNAINAGNSTVNTINTNVGAKADAASATGSLHAKVKDVKSAVSTIAGKNIINHGSAIKSIQRGTIQLSTSETSKTATISSVSTSKTMLNFLGASTSSSYHTFRLQLTSSTQITVNRAESEGRSATVSYEVIEYY
jgi:hypothetical protein